MVSMRVMDSLTRSNEVARMTAAASFDCKKERFGICPRTTEDGNRLRPFLLSYIACSHRLPDIPHTLPDK